MVKLTDLYIAIDFWTLYTELPCLSTYYSIKKSEKLLYRPF